MDIASPSNSDLMRIEIDPASAQAFMTAPLKAERNGMPLTLGSALVALDIDPWSLAGELAIAPRRDAVKRLEAVLSRVDGGLPEAAVIARKAIASLPQPSIEGADLTTIVRLASRDRELTGAVLCFVSVTALAILVMLSILGGNLLLAIGGYCLVGLTWTVLPPRRDNDLRVHLAFSSGAIGVIFATMHLAS